MKTKFKIHYLVITKKRLEADKSLSKNMEEKTRLELEHLHKKENVRIYIKCANFNVMFK